MRFLDRLLTIVVTVTLTSAAWILFGTFYLADREMLEEASSTADPRSPGEGARANSTREGALPRVATHMAANDFVVPVAGVRVDQLTDSFTDQRDDGSRLHEALDIMAPRGTPVVAVAPGTVEKIFESGQGGLTVYQRSPDKRTIYYYAHLDSYAPGLEEGDNLSPGDPIGTVGSTGNADPAGPHLHFAILMTTADAEWWEQATPVNPYPLLTGK